MLAFLAAFSLAPTGLSSALEHPVIGGGKARIRFAENRTVVVIRLKGDGLVGGLPDPRCPAASSLRIVDSDDEIQEIDLSCANWKATAHGYRYRARSKDGSPVRKIVVEPERLTVRFVGAANAVAPGPIPFLEAALTVADESFCARMTTTVVNTSKRVRAVGPTQACTRPRPNFVIVLLDDARFDGLDLMPTVQNRIVPEGISFDNAFTPNASCCSSRASILTGLYSLRHGTLQVSGPIGGADTFRESGADQETLAVWLRDAGYRTGFFGKYLNAYTTEANQGPGGTFYVPPGWDRWWAFVTPHYGGVLGESYTVVEENAALTFYGDHSTDAEYSTDLSAEKMRTFIAGAVSAGQPFFALWAPYVPHGEGTTFVPEPAERHAGMFSSLAPWRPPSWNESDTSDKPRWVQEKQARIQSGVGPIILAINDIHRRNGYEALLAADEQVETLLDELQALGVDEDTVVLVSSDNGLGWGEHQVYYEKGCPYEECQRVPMMVRYPRRVPPLQNTAATALNLDIAPTLASLAGLEVPLEPDGASLGPWLAASPPAVWRSDYLLEHWRAERYDELTWAAQVTDGDRLRVFYGDPRAKPRPSAVFEFDAGDGVSPGTVAVPIGADDQGSFSALGNAVMAAIPAVQTVIVPAAKRFLVVPVPQSERNSVYLWEEVDQGGAFAAKYRMPDYFGIRDVPSGLTWVEYETGERELYDLTADPWQLENEADDPAYQSVRLQLEDRLVELLAEIEAR